jgi:elongation factor Ts
VSEIPASLVKQLRDETGAGMMDCKRALQETNGDFEAAKRLLRERGMASAGKRAGKGTSEGLVGYRIADGRGVMVAIGCETDFVARNPEFQAFGVKVLEAVEADGVDAVERLDDERTQLISKLGENIAVIGAERYEASNGQVVDGYVHPPANKIGVLVLLDGGSPELARQLAMHVSFAAPEWASRDDVPAETLERERDIYASTDEVQSKPEAAREKIVDGMLNKRFFAAAPGGVLVDQPWIHDSSKTVGQALSEAGASIAAFRRLSVSGS